MQLDPPAILTGRPAAAPALKLPLRVVDYSVRYARREVAFALASSVPATHLDEVEYVVSELATNALRAARDHALRQGRTWGFNEKPIELSITRGARWTRVDVRDPDPQVFVPKPGGLDDESGRGYTIIDALTVDWWTTGTSHDKTVHALLAMPLVTLTEAELSEAIR